jgi:hypothetical protein
LRAFAVVVLVTVATPIDPVTADPITDYCGRVAPDRVQECVESEERRQTFAVVAGTPDDPVTPTMSGARLTTEEIAFQLRRAFDQRPGAACQLKIYRDGAVLICD